MSSTLIPVITAAGLKAAIDAAGAGLSVQITEIALGDAAYAPVQGDVAMRAEKARHTISGGSAVGDRQVHMTALADGVTAFTVREVGFFDQNGVLFALWSHPTQPLVQKEAGVDLIIAFDLVLENLPADSVTVAASITDPGLTMAEPLIKTAITIVDMAHRQIQQHQRIRKLELKS